METRTELILLQRTMVVVEGVARSLNPEINMWQVAKPVVEEYVRTHVGPQAFARDLAQTAKILSRFGPRLPRLVEDAFDRAGPSQARANARAPRWPLGLWSGRWWAGRAGCRDRGGAVDKPRKVILSKADRQVELMRPAHALRRTGQARALHGAQSGLVQRRIAGTAGNADPCQLPPRCDRQAQLHHAACARLGAAIARAARRRGCVRPTRPRRSRNCRHRFAPCAAPWPRCAAAPWPLARCAGGLAGGAGLGLGVGPRARAGFGAGCRARRTVWAGRAGPCAARSWPLAQPDPATWARYRGTYPAAHRGAACGAGGAAMSGGAATCTGASQLRTMADKAGSAAPKGAATVTDPSPPSPPAVIPSGAMAAKAARCTATAATPKPANSSPVRISRPPAAQQA